MGKKITLAEAQKRLENRNDIVLVKFVSWKKKSKFFDKVAKKHFWSIPSDVVRHNIVHPNRRMKKRKKTNLKRWGAEHATQAKQVKEKTKATNRKKYGKDYYLQTEDKKQKTTKTNLEKYGAEHHMQTDKGKKELREVFLSKYGVENPQQLEEVKEKRVETLKRRYGVDNPSKLPTFQQKKKKTSLQNWGVEEPLASMAVRNKAKQTLKEKLGVEHPMHSPIVKNKQKATVYKRYGVEHWSQTKEFQDALSKKKVVETGQWAKDWLQQQNEPRPSYVTLVQNFTGEQSVFQRDLEEFLERYRSSKTNLERLAESVLAAKHYNRKPKKLKKCLRPDFKLSPQIFVNVDGLYWHSELQKNKWDHWNARKEFETASLRLFQFREDEIRDKPQVVKSICSNALGKVKQRCFARKTKVKKVSQGEANDFLAKNHLMGSINAKHIGLYDGENLVSLLSYRQRMNVCKIARFCSVANCVVPGGFSKLLKHLEKHCLKSSVQEIHNWVDLRYGTGKHLSTKGFIQKKETLGWKWTDGTNTFNRLRCRANMDERGLKQSEYASEFGWYKIYDAGQRLYVKTLTKHN